MSLSTELHEAGEKDIGHWLVIFRQILISFHLFSKRNGDIFFLQIVLKLFGRISHQVNLHKLIFLFIFKNVFNFVSLIKFRKFNFTFGRE